MRPEAPAHRPGSHIPIPDHVRHVLGVFARAGHKAYAVGGCVRDGVMGETPADWDVATDCLPGEVGGLFGSRVIETGLKHGTVTLVLGGHQTEITTFRLDGRYTDGRRPDSVTFSKDLGEDLRRRDFTVNAMAYNPDSGIVDPYGGLGDIGAKVIRCVGDPVERFSEDYLRILRAFRFASRLGFEIEGETLKKAIECRWGLRAIAAERVQKELRGILEHSDRGRLWLFAMSLLDVVIPELWPQGPEASGPWPQGPEVSGPRPQKPEVSGPWPFSLMSPRPAEAGLRGIPRPLGPAVHAPSVNAIVAQAPSAHPPMAPVFPSAPRGYGPLGHALDAASVFGGGDLAVKLALLFHGATATGGSVAGRIGPDGYAGTGGGLGRPGIHAPASGGRTDKAMPPAIRRLAKEAAEAGLGGPWPEGSAESSELAGSALRRLRFEGGVVSEVRSLVLMHGAPFAFGSWDVKRFLGALGERRFHRLAAMGAADAALHRAEASSPGLAAHGWHAAAGLSSDAYTDAVAEADRVIMSKEPYAVGDLAVDGGDLSRALGLAPSAAIGSLLSRLLDGVMRGGLRNDKASLLSAAERLCRERGLNSGPTGGEGGPRHGR
ncbi:MAG: hypothetical protein FWE70_05565 [Oscillospiraceae bacterium]|nr:hypothetical protein [Oscillospiraceae bacterium]